MIVPSESAEEPAPAPTPTGTRPVAFVLRVGGVLGVLLVAAGLLLGLGQDSVQRVDGSRSDLLDGSAALRLSDLPGGLRHGQAGAVMLLGMVVLAATPAAGVAAAGLMWLRSRRLWLAAVAALVLALLALASVLGAAG